MGGDDEQDMRERLQSQASRLKWLKRNPRAMHFFLFHLLTKTAALANGSIRNTKSELAPPYPGYDPGVTLTAENMGGKKSYETKFLMSQYDPDMQDGMGNKKNIEVESYQPQRSITIEEAVAGNKKETNSQRQERLKCYQANGLDFSRIKNTNVIPDVLGGIIEVIMAFYSSLNSRDKVIKEVVYAWANASNQFPNAFSWLDKNNEKQCQWVWEQMRKKYISIDTKPISCEQRYHFIIAIFDNWKGWSDEQLGYLKENKRRKDGKLISHGLGNASALSHKEILLEELGKAWEQKSRRKKIKDTAPTLKLNKIYQKRLNQIAEGKHMTLDEALKCLIDNELLRVSMLKAR
ncbi:Uncharacterised protein [Yersinia pseudotuberculosis]|uniref:hypothetical protein n=1 Tax=Yersinia pseudotuberculosis TaxID=633 RepID=UPI0005E90C26|nr:hypothetical protein [Yersinia pseudotuberculosis]CNH31450.1 Uncharacterised protein [Yersinia pseudotuberculosis]